MSLGFKAFASSSSGNCYLIRSETTSLIVDVGISAAKIMKQLEAEHVEKETVKGIFVTHEHVDHVKSLSALYKKIPHAQVITSRGTAQSLEPKLQSLVEKSLVTAESGECLTVGDIQVNVFKLSHDSTEPVAFYFTYGGSKIAIVTDTGCVTEEIFESVWDADILVLESNHEENILLYGRYPYAVKRRILSDYGHLSNDAAGRCLCRILDRLEGSKTPQVFLAHLSRENNTPEQAYLTVKNVLEENDYYIGKDLFMEVMGPEGQENLTVIE